MRVSCERGHYFINVSQARSLELTPPLNLISFSVGNPSIRDEILNEGREGRGIIEEQILLDMERFGYN